MNNRILFRALSCLLSLVLLLGVGGCKSTRNNSKPTKERVEHIHVGKGNKLQKKIVDEAMAWIGTPYAYARNEKGIGTDCSGLVMTVYEQVAGVKIPRNSAKQAEFCTSINDDDVRIGDLVFFATGRDAKKISHVGIVIGDDSFIHASSKKGVVISKINTPYYTRTFRRFGRVPLEKE